MSMIAIIDYGLCNVHSVASGVKRCDHTPCITDQAEKILEASHIILPGVGSFADAMQNIRDRKLDVVLTELVMKKNVSILGICLGMQLLASRGYEGGETEGLNFIDAKVKKLKPNDPKERIPHIGWNEVYHKLTSPLFTDIPDGQDFYFVHSFTIQCTHANDVLAETPYCETFTSVIGRNNIFGTQFHPEKSQKLGLKLLKNFLTYC